MMITPEKIEMWKQDPKLYDYDRGHHNGSMDAWNESKPMIFTNEHSKAFRQGYCEGWAEAKTHLITDDIYRGVCGQDNLWECTLCEKLHKEVCEQTKKIAECSDDDVPEYSEDVFEQAIDFFEHPEKCKPKKRIVARDGKIILKEGYDNE